MNNLSVATQANETLPSLIDRAATALASARDSGEVLEARDIARVAYDAAKSAGRMARAKKAHDEVIGAVYRAQADALLIEARAKMRLADEYDAAQERGELNERGGDRRSADFKVGDANFEKLKGLRRDEIHEARQLRNMGVKTLPPESAEKSERGLGWPPRGFAWAMSETCMGACMHATNHGAALRGGVKMLYVR